MNSLYVCILLTASYLTCVNSDSHGSSHHHDFSGALSSITNWFNQYGSSFNTHNTHVDDGCDHPDKRDHLIQLLTDWYFHQDYAATLQFYYDIVLLDMSSSSQSLPDRHKARGIFDLYNHNHDEAYTNGNTVPDVKHLEDLAMNQMNAICRRYVLQKIETYLHPSSVAVPTTTTHRTHSPHQHHTNAPSTTTRRTHHVHHTDAPTTTTTRAHHVQHTNAPTTTTAKPVVTTTTSTKICDALTFVGALARKEMIIDNEAGMCKDGSHSQSEALLLESCKSPPPTTWTKGINVMQNCKSIPRYTPVATFLLGNYVTDGTALSGVFVECTPTGFKIGAQLCGHTPQIYELTSGGSDNRQNANSYFVVDWN